MELAAYGLADAEHQVEKEVRRCWPGAQIDVLEVTRPDPAPRIVEEFAVRYRIRAELLVDAPSPSEARAAGLRRARELLAGTRVARVEWAEPVVA